MVGAEERDIRRRKKLFFSRQTSPHPCIDCKKTNYAGVFMKDYIEERAVEIAYYIIENKATVRQTAVAFGVSKSTIHIDVTIRNEKKI